MGCEEIMPTTLPSRSRASTGTAFDSGDDLGDRIISDNLATVLGFCAVGLLITINVMLRFPDLGALIERYNQF
jgi:hypothetical protein